MTNKEIRALIEKRRKDWRYGNSVEAKYKAEECNDFLELIDSLHEEPKFKVGDIIKHKHYEHWETEEVIEVTAQGVKTNIGWLSFPDQWELAEEPKPIKTVRSRGKLREILDNLSPEEVDETRKKMLEEAQEEPVSGNIDFEQELYKAFGQVKDFTLGIAIAKRFYDMGKNSKDSQEPVSEDLEEASKEWLRPQLDKSYSSYGETKMMELTRFDGYAMLDAIEFSAKWQKGQFEKNRLKHCNSITNEQAELEQGFIDQHLDKHQRIPTFLDAIEYGMNIQKEQMMKDAVDATVHIDAGGYPYIPQIELYNYIKDVPLAKEGDKYKVILIKED